MLKITCNMHTKQEWAFGRTENVDERIFYGEDEFDIMRQQDEIIYAWYEDPAVKSVYFKEVSREELEEEE